MPSLILMALLFAFGHAYQGVTGVVDNVLWGIGYGALHLVSAGKLWLPVVAHGLENTVALVLLFFGLTF